MQIYHLDIHICFVKYLKYSINVQSKIVIVYQSFSMTVANYEFYLLLKKKDLDKNKEKSKRQGMTISEEEREDSKKFVLQLSNFHIILFSQHF